MADFKWDADARMAQLLDGFMHSRWPGRCQLTDLATSPYTITADQHFILDRLPGLEQVILFCGDCGRGFKFSILLSRWAALLCSLHAVFSKCLAKLPCDCARSSLCLLAMRHTWCAGYWQSWLWINVRVSTLNP